MQSAIEGQVFRFPWQRKIAIFGTLGLFLFWLCIHRYHAPVIAVLPLFVIVRAFAEYRRKIVISESKMAYWPPMGSAQTVTFADVQSIELGEMAEIFVANRTFGPGAKFKLVNGVTFSIPLGLRDHERVFEEIVKRWKMNRGESAGP